MIRLDRPQVDTDAGDEDAWLASFSDLIVLMLCFFVVLTAIFAIKEGDAFEAAIDSLRGLGKTGTHPPEISATQEAVRAILTDLQALAFENITVTKQPDGIEIEISDDDKPLFEPGSANLTEDAQKLIFSVSRQILYPASNRQYTPDESIALLSRAISQVEIQGHTDSLPTSPGSPYASNWELSLVRANNVRRFLVHIGFPDPLLRKARVTGYADNKPVIFPEVAPNDPQKTHTNRARNRRVVLFLSTART